MRPHLRDTFRLTLRPDGAQPGQFVTFRPYKEPKSPNLFPPTQCLSNRCFFLRGDGLDRTQFAVDLLRVDRLADRSTQFAPNFFHINGLPFVGKARIAGDDEEPRMRDSAVQSNFLHSVCDRSDQQLAAKM